MAAQFTFYVRILTPMVSFSFKHYFIIRYKHYIVVAQYASSRHPK